MPDDIEIINGPDTGAVIADKLYQAMPKVNRNFQRLKVRIATEEVARAAGDTALDTRIDNIVASGGESNIEIVDSRLPESGPAYPTLKDRLDEEHAVVIAQLADIAYNVIRKYGADPTGVSDSTSAIQAAIDAVDTTEYTEAIPTNGAKGIVFIPSGRYKVTGKIKVPSYVRIVGAGRHNTFLDSAITNGDPVIEVIEPTSNQQFYVTLESFTINGRNSIGVRQNCQGIKIYKTSRWVIRDVIIEGCAHEGLYTYSAFLGEVYSTLVRACGDETHYAVHLTGVSSSSGGSHAISFFGGELNGGTGTGGGLYAEYGNSITLNGTTVEGFSNGAGITVKNANSFMVNGCYFELNKEDIVEIGNTLGSAYTNNIFASLAAGARGIIGITYAQGCKISGNYFQGSAAVKKIFDASGTSTGKLHMSAVYCNYSTAFPITIETSILDSARVSGTSIETYDSTSAVSRYGNHKFNDAVEIAGDLKPTGGIKNIGGFTRTNIVAGTGSPEGVVTADPGSIYLREDGDRSSSIYFKAAGVNNSTGWLPMQGIHAGTTANRPTVASVGYQYFDTTLGKPIWFAGTGIWKDATGTSV